MASCLHTCTFLRNLLKFGQLKMEEKNETDRTAFHARVSIYLKVNALGLKLLNTQPSDQALSVLLFGNETLHD